MVYNITINYKI